MKNRETKENIDDNYFSYEDCIVSPLLNTFFY